VNYIFKLSFLGILSIALIENGYAKNPNETSTNKGLGTLQVRNSIGISSWGILEKSQSNSNESKILQPKENSEIESWDIWENGDPNLEGYLWTVNLKSGPFPTKDKAKQAGTELINVTRNTINLPQNNISTTQAKSSKENKRSSTANYSWAVNFRLGSYKSRDKALKIVKILKVNQALRASISLSREPININTFKPEVNSQSKITGELLLTQSKVPVKSKAKYSILISTKGNSLNVRKGPSTSSPIISKLPNGIKVPYIKKHINEKNDDLWFFIKYSQENYGWVSSKYSKRIIDSSSTVSKQNSLNPLNTQRAHVNNESDNKQHNKKETTARIQKEIDKESVKRPKVISDTTTKIKELKPSSELYISRIADLQKINAALLLENERNYQKIADLRRTNIILEMEKEFKTKELLKLKATSSDIQTELDKIKSEKPMTTKEVQITNEINTNKLLISQKTNASLRLENEDKIKKIAYLNKLIANLSTEKELGNKTLDSSKVNVAEITTAKNLKLIEIPIKTKEGLNSTDVFNTQNIIKPYLVNWIKGWENRNIDLYLSFYSKNFVDPRRSYSKWEASRRSSLNKSTNISIKITDLKTHILNNNSIKVTFIQQYMSNIISDIGTKEMWWKKEEGNWKIIKEIWQPQ
jgi:uncharacterized protein YraI